MMKSDPISRRRWPSDFASSDLLCQPCLSASKACRTIRGAGREECLGWSKPHPDSRSSGEMLGAVRQRHRSSVLPLQRRLLRYRPRPLLLDRICQPLGCQLLVIAFGWEVRNRASLDHFTLLRYLVYDVDTGGRVSPRHRTSAMVSVILNRCMSGMVRMVS